MGIHLLIFNPNICKLVNYYGMIYQYDLINTFHAIKNNLENCVFHSWYYWGWDTDSDKNLHNFMNFMTINTGVKLRICSKGTRLNINICIDMAFVVPEVDQNGTTPRRNTTHMCNVMRLFLSKIRRTKCNFVMCRDELL